MCIRDRSYGLQGNIDKNTSPFLLGNYSNQTVIDKNETIITIGSAPNDKLRWEKTASYNAGIDLSVLKSAINLSIDSVSYTHLDVYKRQPV